MTLLDYIHRSPVATFIFLVTLVTSVMAFRDPVLKSKLILRPFAFKSDRKYWTIITSGLIHANFMHLLLNMMTFFFFAFALEWWFVHMEILSPETNFNPPPYARFVGHAKFFFLYLFCLVVADFSTILKHHDNPAYATLGASGAISGLVMSMILINPQIRIFDIQGWLFAILYLFYSYFSARRGTGVINHDAHLWGALGGIVFTFLFFPKKILLIIENMLS